MIRLRPYRLILRQMRLIADLMRLLDEKDQQLHETQLEHVRELQGMAAAWMLSIERGVDMRDTLMDMDTRLGERIAVLEEYLL